MADPTFLYRRGSDMRSRVLVGLVAVLLIVIGIYLAFTKSVPFTGHGYEISAVSTTRRRSSPTRRSGSPASTSAR